MSQILYLPIDPEIERIRARLEEAFDRSDAALIAFFSRRIDEYQLRIWNMKNP